jgi:RHS repeat-associated protein
VTDAYEYDAFGNQIYRSGTTPNNYMYRGEQFDPDLSLYYLRARYYNAATGRFLSRDPEDGKAIDPKTLHKYLYVGGDPVNWIDPTGRDMFETGLVLDKIAVATTWSVARLGVEVALCYYGIYEMLEHGINWVSGPVTAVICAMPFVPHPPAPPGPPPPVPPPPPPEPPPPCFDLNCWNPPPGTPIN